MDVLKPNQVFANRYRIERFLAQGGMGAVFVAEQMATELVVAVKVLFPHVLGSQDAIDKFELEARVAARVRSEHIVKVLDAGYDEETQLPFLVMELLEGRPLEDVVVEEGPLSPVDTVTYLRQCASGLDKAHGYTDKSGVKQPIVHRDLKPENLFLAKRESGEPLVKILDFGIAKVLTDTANLSQELKGTPLYMAYEQASGTRISPQTDIWAFGLIAFFLLTGKPYWAAAAKDDAGLPALFGEILTQPLVAPSARAKELGVEPSWGPEFDAWFLRCIDREPTNRFSTAGEAAATLADALDVTVSESSSGPIPLRSDPMAFGATIDSATLSQATAPPQRKSGMTGMLLAAVIGALAVGGGAYAALSRDANAIDGAEEAAQADTDPPPADTDPAETAEAPTPAPTPAHATAEEPSATAAPPEETQAPEPKAAPKPTVARPRLAPTPRPAAKKRAPVARPAPQPAPKPATRDDLYGER